MTSQAQALAPLPGVSGLVFFRIPAASRGSSVAGARRHLSDVNIPMLFLQGTRDDLATLELLHGSCTDSAPALH